ncbi:tetratricopeptide repeat-containing sulfotransferase family protein [Paraburkholderia caballeronis]|uniref:Tfp pilus assembly protein PilF n=1 Tax=Paraburkholderia caballeronis TaxID=416943 RepID=A0A1H7W6K0_9BURK|nr:tetratricopeptide repeat-containing sulfotransferase family protein [Paraburkholderia caballeronis]PXW16884.1 Tfp pilus assembly protein PilF [Paraburkholderia caballeronis]PXW94668.1 Tfp pilus assembly protein PilF [Paraburkholderia caballeronis]RAJ89941.1 Tfp pilus assembly protein PilF [Paraburkholderia caballeronis]SEB60323.1 Tfp pilus assembly protein PilF [Paraburkholderia caballeronis]SEM16608.1 Tfp pilus assembly protein PilF [Paraburkholderia caballeronis]
MSSSVVPNPMSIADAMSRAHAHWNAGQANEAEIYCQRVLAAWPGQADALHLLGLMAHAYGNLDLAIDHLRQACMAPRAPAIYSSNLAEMYRRKGMLAEGEEAARRAVAMDPALVEGWNNLGILLQEAGKLEQSRDCLERVVALTPNVPQAHNNLANTYRRLARLDLAGPHYREALKLDPDYAEAHSNLAFLLTAQGQYEQAAAEARVAIELSPQLVDAYLNLADAEITRRRHGAALQALDALQSFAPQHPAGLMARAQALKQLERMDRALECARQAVALAPRSADAHHTLAQVLQALGETGEALAEFEQAAALPGAVAEEALIGRATLLMEAGRKAEATAAFDAALARFPGSARVLSSRADAKTFAPGDPDVGALEALLADGERRPLPDRMSAHFSLGKAYLDIGDAARAFSHLDQANRLKRSTFSYDSAATGQWMQRIADVVTPALLERLKGAGVQSDLPVFIVGMPRSGTTLAEQILSSHSAVTGAGELSTLRVIVEEHGGFPDAMGALTADEAARMGRAYLDRITPLARGSARLIDKMPGNFLYAGLIPLILPGARIIHCRRDAVDTCLSCYTKQFAGDQSFAYDQTELGEFYRYYERLMSHWAAVLPAGRYLELDYESVVDDLEGEARRLIGFLGLQWEDACLRFHDNQRVVRTASVNQVRRPIYSTSKGRWQRYASHLEPLLAALGVDA